MAVFFREPKEETWNEMNLRWFWLLWGTMQAYESAEAEKAKV